jgi:predicted nucleic acid-binding Zn finger protein
LSRLRRPNDLAVDEWQIKPRRQFGREQAFLLENLGDDPVFSEFAVTNPASHGRYRAAIRGAVLGENFCTCPDYAGQRRVRLHLGKDCPEGLARQARTLVDCQSSAGAGGLRPPG